jgi:hypothetical protein
MATINDPNAANRLARAIASDLVLYNDKQITQGGAAQNPFMYLSAEIMEGYDLYKSRVTLAHRNLFAPAILSIFEARVIIYGIPPQALRHHLTIALGAHAAEAGALAPSGSASLLPPTAGSVPLQITKLPTKRNGLEAGHLWLLDGALAFEDAAGKREEHSLSNLQGVRITRTPGGELELRVEASYQEQHFTLRSLVDLTTLVLHLLPALDDTPR